MKEQILYLDAHDDYHSMRDKIGWVQTDRVLLVVPPRRGTRRLFSQPLDLQLIQRHAAHLGAKLAVVTDDPIIGDYADGLGIQIFDKVDDSHLRPWRSRRPLPPTRQPRSRPDPDVEAPLIGWPRVKALESPRLRLALGAFIFFNIIALLTMLIALTLPGAHITLTPRTQPLFASVTITADPAQTQIGPAGLIPARPVTASVSGSTEVATTGMVDEATQKAGGYVTFTNLTNVAVRIPAGTAVRTTGGTPIRFVTQEDASLEARKGAAGRAYVLAADSGPLGNVASGLINRIEGPLTVQAAAINEDATTGGEVHQVAAVTNADRERAKAELLAQLRQQGYAQVLTQLGAGEFAPIESLTVAEILDETYDHFTGEKADRLKLDLRIKVSATAVDAQTAFQVGQAALDTQLGNSLKLIPGTTAFVRRPAVAVDQDGRVKFDITAQAEASAVIDPDAVRAAAQWQLAEQTADLLAARFPLVMQPTVVVWPAWFPQLPWLPWRIDVEIRPEATN